MASPVSVVFGPGTVRPDDAFDVVSDVFAQVEEQCTRFDPSSDLMRANARGGEWTEVGSYCFDALRAAERAYLDTAGRFDPRVLQTLQRLGYARSMDGADPGREIDADPTPSAVRDAAAARWAPEFDPDRRAVRVGPRPIDLGGIGKGLAVRWAAQRIDSPSFLIDAGGDCLVRGVAPDGPLWRLGVENPRGGDRPVAVLALTDAACVTSSIRYRSWRARGTAVHHLIDPRTGAPGGEALLSVTVVGSDPAESEVWAKVLFLRGSTGIADAAAVRGAAALWVREDGTVGLSEAMRPLVVWQDTAP
jgi:thiamine biosynthesis lipoprotein